MTYAEWISANVVGDGYGQCRETTAAMVVVFPELRQVRGHYYCPIWGERGHWWLVQPDGTIIDPTVNQFPSKGSGVYVEWEEWLDEPTGICPNCSGYVFGGGTCCSENCHIEYAAYCMQEW